MRILLFWLKILFDTSNVENQIARYALLHNVSYLFPDSDKNNLLLGFYELKSIWSREKVKTHPLTKECRSLVFDRSESYKFKRVEYLKNIGLNVEGFISKADLIGNRAQLGLMSISCTYFIGLIIASIAIFTPKNRVNLALMIRSFFEGQILLKLIGLNWSGSIHDFVQYDTDSNVLYRLIKSVYANSITYYKYPSPGPLLAHNKYLLSDILCYNHPYHLEEIDAYSNTIKIDQSRRVSPESFFLYRDCYISSKFSSMFTIGFYSHAGWFRKSVGHADDGLNIAHHELKLLKKLKVILDSNQKLQLVIFLHPKEKTKNTINESRVFYSNIFDSNGRVSYSNGVSTELFHKANVGVGVYSTILFERLICGMPTLMKSPVDSFPIKNSTLSSITVKDDQIEEMLTQSLRLSPKDFFKKHGLSNYVDPNLTARSEKEDNS